MKVGFLVVRHAAQGRQRFDFNNPFTRWIPFRCLRRRTGAAQYDPVERRQVVELEALDHGLNAQPLDAGLHLAESLFSVVHASLAIDGRSHPGVVREIELRHANRELRQEEEIPLRRCAHFVQHGFDPLRWHPATEQVGHRAGEDVAKTHRANSTLRRLLGFLRSNFFSRERRIARSLEAPRPDRRLEFLFVESIGDVASVAVRAIMEASGHRIPAPQRPFDVFVVALGVEFGIAAAQQEPFADILASFVPLLQRDMLGKRWFRFGFFIVVFTSRLYPVFFLFLQISPWD